MNKNSKAVVAVYTQRLNGLRMYKNGKTKVVIEGKSYSLSQMIKTYQASLDARALANAKYTEFQAAVIARNAADTATNAIEDALKAWVTIQFGLESQEALEFGFAPKRNPRTKSARTPKASAPVTTANAPQGAPPSGSTTPGSS